MTSPTSAGHQEPSLRVRRDSVIENAKEVLARLETIQYLVASQLRAGHRNKVLGNLWTLLDPLLLLGVYYLVFGIGLRQAGDNPGEFVIYLGIGVLAFRFLEGTLTQSANCIRANRGLVEQVPFPKAILPIVISICRLYDFVWGLAVLCIAIWFAGFPLTTNVGWILVFVGIQFALCTGFAYMVACVGAFFADTTNIVTAGTRLLFFASPIFYFARPEPGHPAIVPPEYAGYYYLNPLATLIEGYRDALLWGRTPSADTLLYPFAVSFVALGVGFAIFSRRERRYAKSL